MTLAPGSASALVLAVDVGSTSARAGVFPNLRSAGRAMVHQGASVAPDAQSRAPHARGYAAFRLLLEQREQVLHVLQTTVPPAH